MKFKLDENIGRRGLELLKARGHDVMTVWDQGLHGVADEELFQVCSRGERSSHSIAISARLPVFLPERSAGIVVLDVGSSTSLRGIIDRLQDFLAVLENQSVAGALWIVEPGRVRVHLRDDE